MKQRKFRWIAFMGCHPVGVPYFFMGGAETSRPAPAFPEANRHNRRKHSLPYTSFPRLQEIHPMDASFFLFCVETAGRTVPVPQKAEKMLIFSLFRLEKMNPHARLGVVAVMSEGSAENPEDIAPRFKILWYGLEAGAWKIRTAY